MTSLLRSLPLIAFLFFTIPVSAQKKKDNTPLVNCFIGTEGKGHTYPGAVLPYGMVQLSPVSRLTGTAYQFTDTVVYGFTHTRYTITDSTEESSLLFMPTLGEPKLNITDNQSAVDKKEESASPGLYTTFFKNGIEAELTATLRAGLQQYKFPKTDKANVIIDLQHGRTVADAWVEVVNNRELKGYRLAYNRPVYFYAKFSKAFKQYGIAANDVLQTGKNKADGKNIKMFVQFDDPGEVLVKVGLSHVSAEGALKNLDAEIPEFKFKDTQKAARAAWVTELAKIQVEGGGPGKQSQNVPGQTPRPKNAAPFVDFALMKRTAFYTALYHTMLTPSIAGDIDGQYRISTDKMAIANGFDYYEVNSLDSTNSPAYQILTLIDSKRTLDIIKSYLESPVSQGAARFAPLLVDATLKDIKDTQTENFYKIAKSVMDTVRNNIELVKTEEYLDALFSDHTQTKTFNHLPYLYSFTKSQYKTQLTINNLLKRYTTEPTGLISSDNQGQLSAWHVLNSLGIYNVIPGSQQYIIGLPQFDKAVISLANNKKFTILNSGASITRGNIYIQGLNLDKSGYTKLYLNYADIAKGGEFEIFTGTMPNKLFMQDLEKPTLKVVE